MAAEHFNKDTFEEKVSKGDKIALVDFFAVWCGPCQMASPIIDKLADEYKEKMVIGKVNVDEERELAQKYEIMSIPCMIMFKDGKEIDRKVGFPGESGLRAWIEEKLENK